MSMNAIACVTEKVMGLFALCFPGAGAIVEDIGIAGIAVARVPALSPAAAASMNSFGTSVLAGQFAPMRVYRAGAAPGGIVSFRVCSRILEDGKMEG